MYNEQQAFERLVASSVTFAKLAVKKVKWDLPFTAVTPRYTRSQVESPRWQLTTCNASFFFFSL